VEQYVLSKVGYLGSEAQPTCQSVWGPETKKKLRAAEHVQDRFEPVFPPGPVHCTLYNFGGYDYHESIVS
jgi:hypothetical protein